MDPGPPIEIDGATGEGGGQVLRTALSLSAITGRPFRARQLRRDRQKAGLRPQHVAAARATAAICSGRLTGDAVGSMEVSLEPRVVTPGGTWHFDIGTAGSAPLLFQTLCFPLAIAGGEASVSLHGGTHQDHSPSFHYLALVWAPAVGRLGFPLELSLQRAGFYPEGGGELTARVHPARAMPPLDLRHRGNLVEAEAVSLVAGIDFAVAERQAERAERRMRAGGVVCTTRAVPMPAGPSRGSHLLVVARFDRTTSGHSATATGDGDPDRVADDAVASFVRFVDARGAVDPHLADQLLLPAALVAAGRVPRPDGLERTTRFSVGEVTRHLTTNASIIPSFLPVDVTVSGPVGGPGEVVISPRA